MAECIQKTSSNDGKEKYPRRTSLGVVSDDEWFECNDPDDVQYSRSRSSSITFDGEGVIIKGKSSFHRTPSPKKMNIRFNEDVTEIARYSIDKELEQDDYLSVDGNNLSTISPSRQFPKKCVYRAGTPAVLNRRSSIPTVESHGSDIEQEAITWGKLGADHIAHGSLQRAGTPEEKDGQYLEKVGDLRDLLKP